MPSRLAKAHVGRGGARPGAGRPSGSKNPTKTRRVMSKEFLELTEPLDRFCYAAMVRILNLKPADKKGTPDYELIALQIRTADLALSYRHGKPTEAVVLPAGISVNAPNAQGVMVVSADANSHDYVSGLRRIPDQYARDDGVVPTEAELA